MFTPVVHIVPSLTKEYPPEDGVKNTSVRSNPRSTFKASFMLASRSIRRYALSVLRKTDMYTLTCPIFCTSPTESIARPSFPRKLVIADRKFKLFSTLLTWGVAAWALWAIPNGRSSTRLLLPLPFEFVSGLGSRPERLSRPWCRPRPQGRLDNRSGLLYRHNGIQREGASPGFGRRYCRYAAAIQLIGAGAR